MNEFKTIIESLQLLASTANLDPNLSVVELFDQISSIFIENTSLRAEVTARE